MEFIDCKILNVAYSPSQKITELVHLSDNHFGLLL